MALGFPKDFLDTRDFTKQQLMDLATWGLALKRAAAAGLYPPLLAHRTAALIFTQVSTRTRMGFEAGMQDLGGHAQVLAPSAIQLGTHESLKDTARVVGSLADVVVLRMPQPADVRAFAAASAAPVINAMTNDVHPTLELADLMTMLEALHAEKRLEDARVAFVGDASQICTSVMLLATKMGMHFIHVGPENCRMSRELVAQGQAQCAVSGGTLEETPQLEGVRGADFVYTDAWCGLYDCERSKEERMSLFYPTYQVNAAMMRLAGEQAHFMHCLPATRGEEVVDAVLDGRQSLAWEQAQNVRHAARALLAAFCPQTVLTHDAPAARAALEEAAATLGIALPGAW